MKQFNVTGMSCAACSARVEKAVCAVEGVTSCSVSLMTNSMGVEGDVSDAAVIAAVESAGYGAAVKGEADIQNKSSESDLEDKQSPKIIKRLCASVVLLLLLMYFSMGHMMWGFPIPRFFEENLIAQGLLQLILSAAVMIINQHFFISGIKALLNRSPNMDTLVSMGSAASFAWSVYALFAMTDAQLKGNTDAVMGYMHEFWFESAAMILTLITVGKLLEARSKGKTTDALKSLMRLAAKTADLVVDGKEIQVPIEKVKKGDVFVVRSGGSIPVDAVITEGSCAVDESALTGESIPTDKAVGDCVSAGTVNSSGFIKCEALRVGEDTTLSQIIKTVSDAAATKAPIAKVADKVSGVFVPVVIAVSVVTLAVWILVGKDIGYALARAISVLVISCPCALGLATPVAIMVGNGMGAKNGILFKTAASLEQAGRIETVVLDKTGTVTKGEATVTDIAVAEGVSEKQLLSVAYSLEVKSEHPLGKAVVKKCEESQCELYEVNDFKTLSGNGITALTDGKPSFAGSMKFAKEQITVSEEMEKHADRFSKEGKTPLFFALEGRLLGVIAVADVIKEEGRQAVNELKNMGIRVIMLTGDNKQTAEAIGKQAGIDEVIAQVLPNEKENVVKELCRESRTAMVGDGINDAPALTRADLGIAIGAGTDIAIDAANVVLVNSKLTDVPAAIRLGRATLRNIHQNLFWAFFYNALGIPLAAGVFIPVFGWKLDPMFGAAAMSLSSFCVVSNALRLNFFKLHSAKKDKKIRQKIKHEKELNLMTKTMKIEGMMCPHCEARVKKALEMLAQVDEAKVSHESGTAVLTLNSEISDDILKKTVEEQGYKVI